MKITMDEFIAANSPQKPPANSFTLLDVMRVNNCDYGKARGIIDRMKREKKISWIKIGKTAYYYPNGKQTRNKNKS